MRHKFTLKFLDFMLKKVPHIVFNFMQQYSQFIYYYSMNSFMKTDDINDTYIFLQEIGEGNFATVRKAIHKEDEINVAIKIIKKDKQMIDYGANFIENQCQILFRLQHQNIIIIYEVYDNLQYFYIVMEYLEGKDLGYRIINSELKNQVAVAHIIKILSNTLEFCHQNGVIHRDLKPQNILLTDMSQDAILKICDFGLARLVGDQMLTTAVGTPAYMSPEIVSGKSYDQKTDFWSLGVIMYVLLSGRLPFQNQSKNPKQTSALFQEIQFGKLTFPEQYWKGISNQAKDLVMHLLDVNPSKRYSSQQINSHPWIIAQGNVDNLMSIE